ncbi:MAG: DUF4290 domain-containing protein [Bacteroidota bacterium]
MYSHKIVDRQVGRNAELFARSIVRLGSPEKRYPYIRILVSIVEQAHPEWTQAPQKDRQIAHLIHQLCNHTLDENEVREIVRLRDAERNRRN